MGGRDEPGGRHLPSAWGRPLPGAIPFLPWPWCCGGWWCGYLPTGVFARCRGYRPPLGAGTKRPVASPPLHNSPPGAGWPLAPAVVGGGGGALGAVRGPSALVAARTARIMQQGAAQACTARAGCAAPAGGGGQGGDRGGGQGVAAGGWRVAGAPTAHRRAPPPSSREAQPQGFWGPHPGAFAPPPCGFGVGEGRQRPLAAMTHGA